MAGAADPTPRIALAAGAVVVAAGRSRRLPGALPKPFRRAGRRALLEHCLVALEGARSVAAVVVVAGADELERARRLAARYAKVTAVVRGGRRRQDSVERGFRALPRWADPVLVHDGARPLVRPGAIDAAARAAAREGAALLAAPVVDTLKEVEGGLVRATLDRARLWRAETPQAFRREWLADGLAAARRDRAEVTDDAMLVERLGRPVRVVPSSAANLKVTTPEDLVLVRSLLARRRGA